MFFLREWNIIAQVNNEHLRQLLGFYSNDSSFLSGLHDALGICLASSRS